MTAASVVAPLIDADGSPGAEAKAGHDRHICSTDHDPFTATVDAHLELHARPIDGQAGNPHDRVDATDRNEQRHIANAPAGSNRLDRWRPLPLVQGLRIPALQRGVRGFRRRRVGACRESSSVPAIRSSARATASGCCRQSGPKSAPPGAELTRLARKLARCDRLIRRPRARKGARMGRTPQPWTGPTWRLPRQDGSGPLDAPRRHPSIDGGNASSAILNPTVRGRSRSRPARSARHGALTGCRSVPAAGDR